MQKTEREIEIELLNAKVGAIVANQRIARGNNIRIMARTIIAALGSLLISLSALCDLLTGSQILTTERTILILVWVIFYWLILEPVEQIKIG